MALQVLCSGFGRTGTRSLKDALELLGFGPCHHMGEAFENPDQVSHWQAVQAGHDMDWDEVFDGYRSQVDWPGAHVWRELAESFPEAKVLHSVRPEESWWNSFSNTIGKAWSYPGELPGPTHVRAMRTVNEKMVGHGTFGGRWADRDVAVAAYRERLDEVSSAIPAERLLVFDVAQGWGPLCDFLDVAVPSETFPRRNSKNEFWDRLGGEPS